MDNRRVVSKLEFYITNVCNLTCAGCNRFNDLPFKGWQNWKDYSTVIQQWQEKIHIEHMVIMGGEPLLNPSINEWIVGLNRTWNKGAQVLTNGTYIDRVKGLYESVKTGFAWVGVSLHDLTQREEIYNKIRKFYGDRKIEEYEGNDTKMGGCKTFWNEEDRVHVEVWDQSEFKPNAVRYTSENRMTLHQSRPEDAFQICAFQHHKNYHFIRGKIYRCGPVALFPDLDDQFNLDLSDEDKKLLRSYQPLTIDEYDQRGDEFFAHIDDMIPQCKFCPTQNEYHRLVFHDHKKKRVNIN